MYYPRFIEELFKPQERAGDLPRDRWCRGDVAVPLRDVFQHCGGFNWTTRWRTSLHVGDQKGGPNPMPNRCLAPTLAPGL